MKTSLFDFELPQSLIATEPVSPRDAARLLVVPSPACGGRLGRGLPDSLIRDLPSFLKPGDVMVFNDTRVLPARLLGKRGEAKIEVLLHKKFVIPAKAGIHADSQSVLPDMDPGLRRNDKELWRCFCKPAKKLKPGDRITFADDFSAEVMEKLPDGQVVLQFDISSPLRGERQGEDDFHRQLQRYGHMPLPPYIARADHAADKERYQTIYAKHEGSVAAPTAGLHFTDALMQAIDAIGVQRVQVTLHVGGGTFLPVKSEDTNDHVMHSEWAHITPEIADTINNAKANGGRVIAVGTTSLRTLESAADDQGRVQPYERETNIFITPGYRFKAVDMLLTNFHLPKSTLFMLVSAFAGLERMQAAYAHAIAKEYRFYSYGDACLLFCN